MDNRYEQKKKRRREYVTGVFLIGILVGVMYGFLIIGMILGNFEILLVEVVSIIIMSFLITGMVSLDG